MGLEKWDRIWIQLHPGIFQPGKSQNFFEFGCVEGDLSFLWCVAVFWILFSWNTKCFGSCDHLFFTQSALCSCLDCITCTRRWAYWHHLKPFWAMCLFLSLRSQWTQPLILSSMFSSSRSLLFLDQISVYLKVSESYWICLQVFPLGLSVLGDYRACPFVTNILKLLGLSTACFVLFSFWP